MEKMGSSSVPASVVCGSTDSLHGLKFGQKIYFEDVGGGGSSSKASGEASAPASAPPTPKKGKGVVQGGQQPPRCQVEGCNVDLSDAKAYYSRHKVCGMHSKSPKVVVGGLEQRFCQQCSRFHLLPEFDQGKRSCRRRLAGHNERRRKPPPGPLSTRYGRLSSSFYEDNNRFRGFLMDFSYPSRLQGAPREIWPTIGAGGRVMSNQWQGGLNSPPNGISSFGGHQYMQGPSPTNGSLFSAPGIPQGDCLAGVSSGSSCALSLLSTQQSWGSATSTRSLPPSISTSSNFGVSPMAQPIIASSYSSSYGSNAWSFKGHEAGSSSHGDQHALGLAQVSQCESSQFPGELELALQGNRQCMDLDHGSAYDHSDDVIRWSL